MSTLIRSSALSATQRQAVWKHIQTTDKPLADLLSDTGFQELRQEFGASPLFPRTLVDAALVSAGLPQL